jgi:hypothetical protein
LCCRQKESSVRVRVRVRVRVCACVYVCVCVWTGPEGNITQERQRTHHIDSHTRLSKTHTVTPVEITHSTAQSVTLPPPLAEERNSDNWQSTGGKT